jgi:site-specific DNA recombinase
MEVNMKVAAYIRVSTEEQVKEGYSISAQRNRLEAYAISQGWEIVQFYVDEGISAKDLNRPELQRMVKGIKEKLFDCVLVYRLDRLTRSVLDLYQLLSVFDDNGIKFKSATEIYDTTTAMGRMFITIVAALAQWERENLGERIRMGMQEKAKEGKWAMNTAPFGYDLDGIDALKINTSESLVVKEIYSMYTEGKGMHKIARALNEKGIHTKKNKPWSQNSVHYVLTNPIYKGTMRYNYRLNSEQYFEVEGAAKPIVTENEFEMVQKIIHTRSGFHPRQATSRYLFSKILKCGRCGKTLIGKSNSTKRGDKVYHSFNYYCPNRQRGICDLPMINQNHIEEKFTRLFNQTDFEEVAVEKEENEQKESQGDHEETVKKLKKEQEEIQKRRSKWQYAWANEIISDNDFKNRMKEEEEKEKMILKELENLKPKESSTPIDNIIELWSNVKLNWEFMDTNEKKQFVQIAIDSIVVDRVSMTKSINDYVFKEVKFN